MEFDDLMLVVEKDCNGLTRKMEVGPLIVARSSQDGCLHAGQVSLYLMYRL